MLILEEAKAIAMKEISDVLQSGIDLVIDDDHTIAKPYGWVFFFRQRQHFDPNDINSMVGGNGPLVVRHNGKAYRLPTFGPPKEMIAAFEKKHWL
jgi:calcineurin-like phosphoesterase